MRFKGSKTYLQYDQQSHFHLALHDNVVIVCICVPGHFNDLQPNKEEIFCGGMYLGKIIENRLIRFRACYLMDSYVSS